MFRLSAFDLQKVQPIIKNTHVVDAFVGPAAGVAPDAGQNGSITLGGVLTVSAGQVDAGNQVSMDSVSVTLSAIDIDFVRPEVVAGGKTLAHLGGTPADVVRTRMFITDPADADPIGEAHGDVFGDIRPASTMVVVAALLDPRWKIEMELEAALDG